MRLPFPSRCDEVTRALAAPGVLPPDVVAEHLAACPTCAAWAGRDAALTRLWGATRPSEPSAAAWDDVWARVVAGMEAPRPVEVRPKSEVVAFSAWPEGRGRGRFGVALFVAGQAAAILAVAVLWAARRPSAEGPSGWADARAVRTVVLRSEVEIGAGEVVLIREERQGLRPVQVAMDDRPNTLDGNFAMFNDVEAMAE